MTGHRVERGDVRSHFTSIQRFHIDLEKGIEMSAALFGSDGLVDDIQSEWGPAAIKRWADRETVGDNVLTTKFLGVRDQYGDFIDSAEVDSGYDKAGLPELLVPTFSFSLAEDGISRLIILGHKPGY
jgi:hypothetical protein